MATRGVNEMRKARNGEWYYVLEWNRDSPDDVREAPKRAFHTECWKYVR